MDRETLLLLRTEPGSIGETARAYATGYYRVAPVTFKDERLFYQLFTSVLMKREQANTDNNLEDGNLLIPAHTKGLNEIYRIFDLIPGERYIGYKVDLPTMILYSMLLESESYREGLIRMENADVMDVLSMIYEEVKSVCPNQTLDSNYNFTFQNSCMISDFIIEANSERYRFQKETITSPQTTIEKKNLNNTLSPFINGLFSGQNINEKKPLRQQSKLVALNELWKDISIHQKAYNVLEQMEDLNSALSKLKDTIHLLEEKMNKILSMTEEEFRNYSATS